MDHDTITGTRLINELAISKLYGTTHEVEKLIDHYPELTQFRSALVEWVVNVRSDATQADEPFHNYTIGPVYQEIHQKHEQGLQAWLIEACDKVRKKMTNATEELVIFLTGGGAMHRDVHEMYKNALKEHFPGADIHLGRFTHAK